MSGLHRIGQESPMLTFAIAFLLVIFLILVGRPLATRVGLLDRPSSNQKHKAHDAPIPAIGGPAIYGALVSATVIGTQVQNSSYWIIFGVLVLMVLGLIDDLKNLRASTRIIAQIVVVGHLSLLYGMSFDDLGAIVGDKPALLGVWAVPFTIFSVVGLINSINLIDGADGLAAGLSSLALIPLLGLAAWMGISSLGFSLGLAALGALLGFLFFNLRHPLNRRATIFLGDSGSLLIGIVLGFVLWDLTQNTADGVPAVLGLWVLVIPVFDTCSVMIRRMLAGQNPMSPDRQHLHHLLQDAGLSHGKSVALLLLAAAVIGGSAVVLWVLGVSEAALFAAYLIFAALYLWFVIRPAKAVNRLAKIFKVVPAS